MEIIIILLTFVYILLLIEENIKSKIHRKNLKHIIYVNGTRGKSTVTRLIYAGLKSSNIRCASKTTGSVPIYIDPNGIEFPIKRKGCNNIKEQLSILERAYKDKCEVLVIECMAISPELQYITQHKMLRSDIGVITNVRMDHNDVMGNTLIEIANSLSNTIPERGEFFTTDSNFFAVFEKKCNILSTNANLIEVDDNLPDFDFKDNISVALAVCNSLGIDRDKALDSMKNFIRDPYALSIYIIGQGGLFINGLSINDIESTKIVYNHVIEKYNLKDRNLTILINNRIDRGYRTKQLIDLVINIKLYNVWIIGDNLFYTSFQLKKKLNPDVEINCYRDIRDIPFQNLTSDDVVFSIGNIGKYGRDLIEKVSREGKPYE